MIKYTLSLILLSLVCAETLTAKTMVDCRVATSNTKECNPYGKKFIKAKEIKYETDRKKLIVEKTLPVPPKTPIKIISVADIIEKYVKVEDSVRYKGGDIDLTEEVPLPIKKKKEKDDSHAKKPKTEKEISVEKTYEVKKEEKSEQPAEYAKEKVQTVTLEKEKEQPVVLEEVKEKEKIKKELVQKTQTRQEVQKKQENQKTKKITLQGYYVIQKGDSISMIASKFGISKQRLMVLNRLNKGNAILVGKKLILPFDQKHIDAIASAKYVVKSGDSLSSIALDFNVSSGAIMKLNKFKKSTPLRIGQKILLPLPFQAVKNKLKRQKTVLKQKKPKTKNQKTKAAKTKRLAKTKKQKKAKKSKKNTYRAKMLHIFGKRKLRVTATAYSSHHKQTDKTPFLAAWNNRIRPGMKIIAVSRDMLTRYGLRNGSKVKIGGLPGYYTVRDKMNKRFRKRIDIYMGTNRRRALRWGRRSVMLSW